MDYSCEEVREQLEELKSFSHRLGETMGRTADELRATGSSPSAELIADLQSYRSRFQSLQSWLTTQPEPSFAGSAQPVLDSLDDLQRDLESKLVARRACEFLDHLQSLAHADGEHHPTLATCQRARQTAVDALKGPESISRPTCRAILDGLHPLNALWNLVQHQDKLSDEEWTASLERVAEHLGREVATSVARNKLYVPAVMVAVRGIPAYAP